MRFTTTMMLVLSGAGAAFSSVDAQIPNEPYFQKTTHGPGAMGSWFRAHNKQDSTTGHSWCGYPYYDTDLIFAVDLRKMGASTWDYGNRDVYEQSIKKYCGLEAVVTDLDTGKNITLYIGDAFDPKWVRNEDSIDIMLGPYKKLKGDPQGNKNYVIMNLEWELTGKKNTYYAAKH